MSDVEAKSVGSNAGVKKGLPARSLKDAEANAAKVWEAARRGTAPTGAVASALGLKGASGGAWRAHMALLRAFGFLSVETEGVSLTPLGIDVVQDADPPKRQEARRTAFFKVRAYRELVDGYDGEDLPATANIAAKLRFDYGKTEDNAMQAAQAFVDSLQHAGLLDGTIVRKASAAPSAPPPQASGNGSGNDDLGTDLDVEQDDDDVEEALDAAWDEDDEDVDGETWVTDEGAPAVSLSMSLDLSKYRADEVIEILRALGLTRR